MNEEKQPEKKPRKKRSKKVEPKKLNALQDITVSLSRKLNLKDYGGKQYETADIFASRTVKDIETKVSSQVYADLLAIVSNDLELAKQHYVSQFKVSNQADEVEKAKEVEKVLKLTKKEQEGIKDLVTKMLNAKTPAEVKALGEEIKNAEGLNQAQVTVLRKTYTERIKELQK